VDLDAAKYVTFAEIGAGQEIARWFFRSVAQRERWRRRSLLTTHQ